MPSIGTVTKQNDGSFKGELKTLTIRTEIEIRPNLQKSNENHPDYRVYVGNNVEIGSARKKIGKDSDAEYIALVIATPEFGPRALKVNLGQSAGQSDPNVFAIIWNLRLKRANMSCSKSTCMSGKHSFDVGQACLCGRQNQFLPGVDSIHNSAPKL